MCLSINFFVPFYSYDLDPIDTGVLQSASVVKAKFKLEDVVLEGLCFEPRERSQCKDVNQAAIDYALEIADEDTKTR